MIVYKTWIKHFARYEGWFLLGFIPLYIKIKRYWNLYKETNMYRVEWLDIDGEIKSVKGFKTSEEAHEWIRTHHFDLDFEMPMVFYDGE